MKMMMDRLSLEFPKRIGGFLDETARYSVLCLSPKRTEFRFCAFLSAWESTALNDAKATHWLQVWQKECRKRHRELGKTLADPASGIPVPKGHVSQREISKAYKVVLDGLRRVFRGTLSHYSLEESEFPSSHGAPRVLFQNIGISFKTAKQFACPEGLEMFL
jgi:hypothetical protein